MTRIAVLRTILENALRIKRMPMGDTNKFEAQRLALHALFVGAGLIPTFHWRLNDEADNTITNLLMGCDRASIDSHRTFVCIRKGGVNVGFSLFISAIIDARSETIVITIFADLDKGPEEMPETALMQTID